MTPFTFLLYGLSLAASLFAVLFVIFLFVCLWFYLVGGSKRD